MTTSQRTPPHIAAGGGPRPQTSGLTVVGWLLICFAVPPLAMAAAAYGSTYLWVGGGMVLFGAAMVLFGHHRRPPTGPSQA